jgi:hypothetical protein
MGRGIHLVLHFRLDFNIHFIVEHYGECMVVIWYNFIPSTIIFKFNVKESLIKKEKNFPHILYEEIQNGAVAKSYMTNCLLIYGEIFSHFLILYIRKPFLIYDFATAPI